jgi:hypothetical protein
MERKIDSSTLPQDSKKRPATQPFETPPINGSKPVETLRIDEQCKKHIRRDGRR